MNSRIFFTVSSTNRYNVFGQIFCVTASYFELGSHDYFYSHLSERRGTSFCASFRGPGHHLQPST